MTRLFALGSVVLISSGCGVGSDAVVRDQAAGLTYDQFLSMVVQEDTGEFIADGDTLFEDEASLRRFYEESVAHESTAQVERGLAIYRLNGADVKWSATQARNLTYCVSKKFSAARYAQVVSAMASAAAAWEATANVRFVHVTAEDATCTSNNSRVLFDVSPVSGGQYLARSFFPNTTRRSRNVKIDSSSFSLQAPPDLTGILRHELGHTLGFRHEHTRPEAGTCFEDNNWRALTSYDSASVMHYPQCNGTGDWTLVLTSRDMTGARAVYP